MEMSCKYCDRETIHIFFALGDQLLYWNIAQNYLILQSFISILHFTWYIRSYWRSWIWFLSPSIRFVIQMDWFLLRAFLMSACLSMYDLRRTSARRSGVISKSSSMRAHPHHTRSGPRQQKNIISQNNPHTTENRPMNAIINANNP